MTVRLLFTGVVAGVLSWVGPVRSETYPLALKRLEQSPAKRNLSSELYAGSSHHFWRDEGNRDQFKGAVKKEPKKYACDRPLRAVVELGGKEFGFVLDSENIKDKGYHRLYFDFNGNRDLTDDKSVEAEPWTDEHGWAIERVFFPLQVTLQLDGVKFDYPFWIASTSRPEDDYSYAMLMSGGYREAVIELDGKKHHFALVDYNTNGRFNDEFKVEDNLHMSNDTVWAQTGDMLVIDGKQATGEYYWEPVSGSARQYLSKLVSIEGRFYDIKVTECGDKVTLTPSTLPLGSITNTSERFRAILYGKKGLVKVCGEKGKPVPVPEGDWKLLTCGIEPAEMSGVKPADKSEVQVVTAAAATQPAGSTAASSPERAAEPEPSPRDGKPRPRTLLVARGKTTYKAVKVRKDKVVELPFGPPYKPVVLPENDRDEGMVRLALAIVGVGGEVCSNIEVAGNRPHEPSLAIATPDGEIVERGKFEYG